jgi:hypothetical protein
MTDERTFGRLASIYLKLQYFPAISFIADNDSHSTYVWMTWYYALSNRFIVCTQLKSPAEESSVRQLAPLAQSRCQDGGIILCGIITAVTIVIMHARRMTTMCCWGPWPPRIPDNSTLLLLSYRHILCSSIARHRPDTPPYILCSSVAHPCSARGVTA